MRKVLALLGVVFLVGCLFVPLVSASYVCPAAQQDAVNSGQLIRDEHPSSTLYGSAVGVAFTANSSAYLYNVTVSLLKSNAPTGFLVMKLYTVNAGTPGNNAYPGVVLATSTTYLNSASLAGTASDQTFLFDGTYQLVESTDYCLVVEAYNASFTSSNTVTVGTKSSNETGQNTFWFYSSSWAVVINQAVYFVINGDTVTSGATPTPTPSSGDSGGDALLEDWSDIIITWLIPLLLVLVPAFLGLKFLGSMGFFVGLNIGVIICYVSGVSGVGLWAVILMAVMDVAYIFFNRR